MGSAFLRSVTNLRWIKMIVPGILVVYKGLGRDLPETLRARRVGQSNLPAADFYIAEIDSDGKVRDINGNVAFGTPGRFLTHREVPICHLVLDGHAKVLFFCCDSCHGHTITQEESICNKP